MLYQKYDPKFLDEVVGHNKIKKELSKRIKDNEIPQNIFFFGKTGTGKGVFKKIISKTVLCREKVIDFCNECDACKSVDKGETGFGFFPFSGSNINIEKIRMIEDIVTTRGFLSNKKVINIEEFQELNSNTKARDSLLNITEKELPNVHFIFTAMTEKSARAIPEYQKNRVALYNLSPIDPFDIADRLKNIAEKEGETLNDIKMTALLSIAENSGGSLRTAISFLERAINANVWEQDDLIEELGISSIDNINTILKKMFMKDVSFLENDITEDTLRLLTNQLMALYKKNSNVELNFYQKKTLPRLRNYDNAKAEMLLEAIYGLNKYPYQTKQMIEFTLLSVVNKF